MSVLGYFCVLRYYHGEFVNIAATLRAASFEGFFMPLTECNMIQIFWDEKMAFALQAMP